MDQTPPASRLETVLHTVRRYLLYGVSSVPSESEYVRSQTQTALSSPAPPDDLHTGDVGSSDSDTAADEGGAGPQRGAQSKRAIRNSMWGKALTADHILGQLREWENEAEEKKILKKQREEEREQRKQSEKESARKSAIDVYTKDLSSGVVVEALKRLTVPKLKAIIMDRGLEFDRTIVGSEKTQLVTQCSQPAFLEYISKRVREAAVTAPSS